MTDSTTRRIASEAAAAAAALERAADATAEEILVLQAEVAARESEVERLQEICDDRQRVIEELGEHAATYRHAAEDRAGLVAALDLDVQRLRGDLERAERERTDALAAAETAALALDDERQRARLRSGEHDAELRAAHREAQMLRARIDALEDALGARAALIEELQGACDERLGVIGSLTEEINALRLVAEERRLLLETNEARYTERAAAKAAEPAHDGVDWRTVAQERERALQDVSAEAERRAVLLTEVTAALNALQAERDAERDAAPPPPPAAPPDDGVDWRALAEERERALQEVSAEAERRSVLLAEVTAALEGRTREVEDLRKRLTRAF
jgi:chromosome segregation ATPase